MKPGLFVYGTLHPDRAPVEMRRVVAKLTPLGEGTVQGRLLDLGEYPGLVVDDKEATVSGEVFALPDDREILSALDDYEGFHASDPANSLFLRELRDVTISDGRTQQHWVYLYNQTPSS